MTTGRVSAAALGAGLVLLAPAGAHAAVTAAMFPAQGVVTASPRTDVAFRGVTVKQLGTVTVRGSRSGAHRATLRAHSDGRGASLLVAGDFRQGELVTVRVGPAARVAFGDGRTGTFKIGRQVEGYATSGDDQAATGIGSFARLRSQPSLAPPRPRLNVREPNATPAGVLLAPKTGPGQGGPMLLDDRGRIQWFRPMPLGVRANDLRVQLFRGKPALTWWEGRARGGSGRGVGMIADATYTTIKRVRAANGYAADLHEFKLTGRGTAILVAYHKVRRNLSEVGGPGNGVAVDSILQEVELDTGLVRFEWHSIGNVGLREATIARPAGPNEPFDYFHINSADEDGQGGYVVSARHTSGLYRISPTGAVLWRLGGRRSTFKLGAGASFEKQHDFLRQPDGTFTLFDNSAPGVRKGSRAVTLRLDERRRTATLVRALVHPARVLGATQGNVQPLPGGATFVGWGSQGRASEFAADGRLVFDLELPRGFDSYRAYRGVWTGTPLSRPRAAAQARSGATQVFASWNGSTQTRAWRVLAGTSTKALAPVTAAAWTGLETPIAAPTKARYVAVEALGADGAVLGRSAPVRVGGR
jgi:hypothetical protein